MRTTTDAKNWRFSLSISDLAKLLGKAPVTIRNWEKMKLISLPRDESGDRKLTTFDTRHTAGIALTLKRISLDRYELICAAMTLLEVIQRENENRPNRSTKNLQKRDGQPVI